MEIISRKEAKALGLKRYYTGKECPNGHLSERKIYNHSCIECGNETIKKINTKDFHKRNPFYKSQQDSMYAKKYPEKIKAKNISFYKKNKQLIKENQKTYREKTKINRKVKKLEFYHQNKDEINRKKREKRAFAKIAKQDKQPT